MMKLYKVRQRTTCWRDVYVEAENGRIASRLVDESGPIEAVTPWSPASGDRSLIEQAERGEVVISGRPSEFARRLWPIPMPPERVAARAKAARASKSEAPAGLPPLPTSVEEMTDDDWRAIAPLG